MHPSRPAILGDLERAIMDVVWSTRHASVRDVVSRMGSRAPAYTTVMTVMNRLVDKGILRRKPDGQSYRYFAAKSKRAFVMQSSRDIVDSFIRCYGDAAIAQFIDALDDVDPKRVAALRAKLRKGT